MSFPHYPVYRETGTEWLARIPCHWELKKLKRLARTPITNGIGAASDIANPVYPRYIRITDIKSRNELNSDTFRSLPPELAREAPVELNDILLACVGATYGASYLHCIDIGPCCYAGYLTRFSHSEETEARFISYWTESNHYWDQLEANVIQSTVQNFSSGKYRALDAIAPPMEEQKSIADFLDRETAKIDALIAEQQRLIELLQEKRHAVISNAVTKGLNPNAPMKDSGVEWLGEVPEHWVVMGLTKTIGPIVDYRGRTPTKCDSGTLLVTAKNIRNGEIDYELSEEYVDPVEAEQLLQRGRPALGDVLFTMEAPLGQVALVDREDIALAQRVVKFRGTSGRMTNSFLMWWLIGSPCQQQLNSLSTGSTALGIKASKLSGVVCVVPPVDEQQAIDHHIRDSSRQLKRVQAAAETQIELLQERRSALISAAVTGQIDVRGLVQEAGEE